MQSFLRHPHANRSSCSLPLATCGGINPWQECAMLAEDVRLLPLLRAVLADDRESEIVSLRDRGWEFPTATSPTVASHSHTLASLRGLKRVSEIAAHVRAFQAPHKRRLSLLRHKCTTSQVPHLLLADMHSCLQSRRWCWCPDIRGRRQVSSRSHLFADNAPAAASGHERGQKPAGNWSRSSWARRRMRQRPNWCLLECAGGVCVRRLLGGRSSTRQLLGERLSVVRYSCY